MTVPRVVVAAPSSNAGKTSVATGLVAALTARGLAGSLGVVLGAQTLRLAELAAESLAATVRSVREAA